MTRLLVPMNIEALVLGPDTGDVEGVTRMPDFSAIIAGSVLGEQLARTPCFDTISDLYQGPGVHLHWALPDALTHGVATSAATPPDFPALPNRWLIVRFWDEAEQLPNAPLALKCAAWVVESDAIDAAGAGVLWPLPESPYAAPVGRSFPLEQWSRTQPKARVKLTALGYGDPSFAAYYPSCRTSLGFHDELVDLSDDCVLSYLVVGWYASADDDPLHAALAGGPPEDLTRRWAEFLAHMRWTAPGVSAVDAATLPTALLCHGVISGLRWQRGLGTGIPTEPPEVTLGETTVDAFAKLNALRELIDPAQRLSGSALFELLSAFQYDLLSDFEKPEGEGLVGHALHARTFQPRVRGSQWQLSPPRSQLATPGAERAAPVPGELETLLQVLNYEQRQIGQLERTRDGLMRSLYATWYARVREESAASNAQTQAAIDVKRREQGELEGAIRTLSAQLAALPRADDGRAAGASWLTLREKLAALLPDWELRRCDDAPFYAPHDPVVVLHGQALTRSSRHGEDGRYREDGRLLCRVSGQEVTRINVRLPFSSQEVTFGGVDLDGWCAPLAADDRLPSESVALLREALLLTLDPRPRDPGAPLDSSAKRARAILAHCDPTLEESDLAKLANQLLHSYLSWVFQDPRALAQDKPPSLRRSTDAGDSATWELVGRLPAPIALRRWKENPWLPLSLEWQAEWNADADGPPTPPSYRGSVLLTPSAPLAFRERLRGHDEWKALCAALQTMPVLSQALSGFHEQLLMQNQYPELHPLEKDGGGKLAPSPIFEFVQDVAWLAPMQGPDEFLFPSREGSLNLSKAWLVDSFGRFFELPTEQRRALASIALPRRFTQAARVTLRWRAAQNSGAVEGDPICGFIVPNFLDKGIMIYDAQGQALGLLRSVGHRLDSLGEKRNGLASFHWIDIPGATQVYLGSDPRTLDPLAGRDPQLRALVKWLLSQEDGDGQRFYRLLETAANVLGTADGSSASGNDKLSLLMGRPLALARARIELELDGPPARAEGRVSGSTRGVETLKVALRLGGYTGETGWLRDDGLIGFVHGARFVAVDDEHAAEPEVSIAQPLDLTLLMDPARGVSVVSQVLPRSVFHLPHADAAARLESRQVVFSTGPLLSPARDGALRMPEPSDLYGQWSWTHHPDVATWHETTIEDVHRQEGQFSHEGLQILEGWLKLETAPLRLGRLGLSGRGPHKPSAAPGHEGDPVPEFSVAPGAQVTLTWTVVGAVELIVTQDEVALFETRSLPLPTQYALAITHPTLLTVSAKSRSGAAATQSLRIVVPADA